MTRPGWPCHPRHAWRGIRGAFSAVIGTELPGPGSIYLGQTLKFRAPVRPGDDVRVVVEVTDYDESRRGTVLDTRAFVGDTLVLEGEARVIAPAP